MHPVEIERIAKDAWNEAKEPHLPVWDNCGQYFKEQLIRKVHSIVIAGDKVEGDDVFGVCVLWHSGRADLIPEWVQPAPTEAVTEPEPVEDAPAEVAEPVEGAEATDAPVAEPEPVEPEPFDHIIFSDQTVPVVAVVDEPKSDTDTEPAP